MYCSTVMTLLLQLDIDKTDPDYYRYIKEELSKKSTEGAINKKVFTEIFERPEINMKNMNNQDYALVIDFLKWV